MSGWAGTRWRCCEVNSSSECGPASREHLGNAHPGRKFKLRVTALSSALLYGSRSAPLGCVHSSIRSLILMRAKKTILCVDDNEQALSIHKVVLETRGYRVIACSSGRSALEAFEKGGVDLVLSDCTMPEMDGAELVERIKTRSPQTPAILFSGRVKVYEKETRADVFLSKGMFGPAELLEKIRQLLARKRGPK